LGPIAVTDEEKAKGGTQTQQDEPLFRKGMIWVVDEDRVIVEKDRYGLRKGHAMATNVEAPLRLVPLEAKLVSHTYIVVSATLESKGCLTCRLTGERSESG
jgi:hypothetical protein